jgi:hypothetical protein
MPSRGGSINASGELDQRFEQLEQRFDHAIRRLEQRHSLATEQSEHE